MANSTSSILSTSMSRLSGLASGLDTDSIVEQLMRAERIPLNRLYQKKQLAEWKQESYRDIISKLNTFKNTYFNTVNMSSNVTSASSFKKYTGSSNEYVTISGNADATAGSHTVSVISLATNAQFKGTAGISNGLHGEVTNFDLSGQKILLTLDGVTKEIALGDYSADVSKIGTDLQEQINNAFGEGKVSVNFDTSTNKLTFNAIGGATKITLSNGDPEVDTLASLGFESGASNRINTGMTLEQLAGSLASGLQFNDSGNVSFTINSKTFTFSKTTTLSKMMSTINSDKTANVNMSYDETSDRFVLTSKQTGAGNNIVFGSTQGDISFTNSFGLHNYEEGHDASAMIDGVLVTRSTNTFTINNVKYTLNKAHTDPAKESETVSLTLDTDAVFNNIKAFVDDYNKLIEEINSTISEKYDRNYQPLTDEQKKEMSEDEIKKWEAKAKTGLLRNDSMLQEMLYKMRTALSDSVAGISENLSSIGITTGTYSEKGKLIIDESKLKEAIENDPDGVSELFTKKAELSYAECKTSDQRNKRYSTEGLGNRISDILEDYIRTTNGKGMLLQKAGMEGDATQYDNTLYDEIDDYEDDIKELLKKLNDKENYYYSKFTALETYISQMNSQSSYIMSLFGGQS